MAGLAVVIRLQDEGSAEDRLRQMLGRLGHRGAKQHISIPDKGVCFGCVWQAEQAAAHAQLSLPEKANPCVCIADARLDNREELRAALALPADITDCELLLHSYWHWGSGLAERLVGDFALVVWDPVQQILYAARDPFGVRPLFYAREAAGLVAASEIEPIVATASPRHSLEPQSILDILLGDHRQPRQTLFAGVSRLLPGHWLTASRDTLREERYWHPPAPFRQADQRDYPLEFRRLFRQAVADRLDSERPVVAQLSGGLDSSSIVCMAAQIVVEQKKQDAVIASSAVYTGLDCDETPLIDSVVRSAGVPSYRWDGTAAKALDPDAFCVDHPWGGHSPGLIEGDLRLAQERGAAAVLSGFGGDELLFERGIFRDLALSGRWLELLHQARLAPRYSVRSAGFFLQDALRALVPDSLRQFYRRWRPRPSRTPPPWLGPVLREAFERKQAAPFMLPSWDRATQTQRFTWYWLTRPNLWWSLELQTLRAARQGVEMRFPYLDRRLADFVLAIPFEERLPGGQMKRLLRDAMAAVLPEVIVNRRSPTTFDAVARLHLQKNCSDMRKLFSDSNMWNSYPYIDRQGIKNLLEELDSASLTSVPYASIQLVLDVAQLEGWITGLRRNRILSEESQ
jgi:asparagine synthase (glutamine-hydrolysing)